MANALIGNFLHDSAMTLTLTDSLFSLDMLSAQLGSTITVGTDVLTVEQVTVTTPNKVTVGSTPQKFGNFGVIGWASKVGEDEWTKVEFDIDTKTATYNGAKVGDVLCVKYAKEDASAEEFIVNSSYIPMQVYAVLTLPLFKSGTDTKSYTSSSKIGEVIIEIPNFMFDGNVDLSLTASGATTTPLSGHALATFTGLEGCDSNDGYYAKLKQVIYNKDEFADVKTIVVADSNIELKTGEKQTLQVYAIYNGGIKAPKLLDNSKLTFTSSQQSYATVGSHSGEIEAVAAGTTNIEVMVTNKTELTAVAVVEVANGE